MGYYQRIMDYGYFKTFGGELSFARKEKWRETRDACAEIAAEADARVAELEKMVNKYAYERDLARRERDAAEADAAALREALELGLSARVELVCASQPDETKKMATVEADKDCSTMRAALNTNAGKELLERIARLEGLLREAVGIVWQYKKLSDGQPLEGDLLARITTELEAK